jgi:hypothetical protein
MHTLFDFITHVKGIEYILSIMFIAGFILYWEIFKPRPFTTLTNTTRKDLAYMKASGRQHIIGKIATALFVGFAYIVSLPFVFAYAIFSAVKNSFTNSRPGKYGPDDSKKRA